MAIDPWSLACAAVEPQRNHIRLTAVKQVRSMAKEGHHEESISRNRGDRGSSQPVRLFGKGFGQH
jgi:hypothetical protein